jgi:hypothetical protein
MVLRKSPIRHQNQPLTAAGDLPVVVGVEAAPARAHVPVLDVPVLVREAVGK